MKIHKHRPTLLDLHVGILLLCLLAKVPEITVKQSFGKSENQQLLFKALQMQGYTHSCHTELQNILLTLTDQT